MMHASVHFVLFSLIMVFLGLHSVIIIAWVIARAAISNHDTGYENEQYNNGVHKNSFAMATFAATVVIFFHFYFFLIFWHVFSFR